ncbi:hypothetical protein VFPPC_14804 [Pochonia chlamydosporia 170]|uniref:Uncharacterized protein n=1 Tax=Pochonia chlamydosporia 170 TaxID=1380566 RepID=A0A179F498_METCM|nr:hypothetical protein VFPPC_14804 [Pochonia chlamydosporia 170]OAQ60244.1 hypothetical protein VFPPC_14804 [Pochonia chlamydosporia 170]
MTIKAILGARSWGCVALFLGLTVTPTAAVPKTTVVNPPSTFFSTSLLAYSSTLNVDQSDGDLWPTTWADDDQLYTANGDGRGFSSNPDDFADIVVNRISGHPDTGISGVRLAAGAAVGPVWTQGTYNRKPTGIIAVDGDGDGKDELYLVVQDLNSGQNGLAFNDVPAASIARSTDYGVTWTATKTPMFTNHTFTTVFFLDFGKSNSRASVLGANGAKYVYAYGLDRNWRDSVIGSVADPQDVYLSRAPISAIQDITKWEFFSGTASKPKWSKSMADRKPVLHDTTRVYPGGQTTDGFSVISQGSVVYNAPLNRYIYTSWTDYTFNFYEAPQPWGPFTLFEWKDFGVTPWFGMNTTNPKNGGYATTIPSKFISADGTRMWVQSNWFVGAAQGSDWNYVFSLRQLGVAKYKPSTASNKACKNNLALSKGTVPICKAAHYGNLDYLNDKSRVSEDSWDGSQKDLDRWGYTWPVKYNMNRVVYTTGNSFPDGGWFSGNLKVQVRQNFKWVDATGLKASPAYPNNNSAVPNKVFTFTFDKIAGDGVQIIGTPGGSATFTSIGELEVYFS